MTKAPAAVNRARDKAPTRKRQRAETSISQTGEGETWRRRNWRRNPPYRDTHQSKLVGRFRWSLFSSCFLSFLLLKIDKRREREKEKIVESNGFPAHRQTGNRDTRQWRAGLAIARSSGRADAMTADDNHDRRQSTCLVFFVPPLPNFILFFVGSSQREEVERGLLDSFKILSVLVFSI